MISPTPTPAPVQQPQPESGGPPDAQKVVKATPIRRRMGDAPAARITKAIFRPLFKGIYYLLRGIRGHKLLTLAAIILLLASITITGYFATGQWPFGIGNDPFNFHVNGGNGGGDLAQHWLYALRDGDSSALTLLDANMSQPPDVSQLISQYSQKQAHLTWDAINVVGVITESDGSIDSIIEVNVSAKGPGAPVTGYELWHFTTFSNANGSFLLSASLVGFRAPLG
jgi:hypothetical protein